MISPCGKLIRACVTDSALEQSHNSSASWPPHFHVSLLVLIVLYKHARLQRSLWLRQQCYLGFGPRVLFNPRRACAARVTVVVLCVCVCVQASHPLLTQLQDQVDIPTDSVSCSLIWRFSYNGFVSKIAIALPYVYYERTVVGHFYTLIFRILSVYHALDFTRMVAHHQLESLRSHSTSY